MAAVRVQPSMSVVRNAALLPGARCWERAAGTGVVSVIATVGVPAGSSAQGTNEDIGAIGRLAVAHGQIEPIDIRALDRAGVIRTSKSS